MDVLGWLLVLKLKGKNMPLTKVAANQITQDSTHRFVSDTQISSWDAVGTGDVTGPSSSVDSEIALFSSTTGKVIKRATNTGLLKATSGVIGTAISGTDYQTPLVSGTSIKTVNSTSLLGSGDVAVGYRNIPQNSQSTAYTLVLTDAGKHLLHPSADTTARVFTIPANSSVAFEIGTAITFINQNGGGVITISITTDTMRLAGAGTTGSRSLAANGIATVVKVSATEWLISGVGLT